MPQIPKHRKVKRTVLLVKRTPYLRNHPGYKSYKPLCDKLKTNNNTLAKALSKEKLECQYLFSENVKLVAEVQDLRTACSKRDSVLSGVVDNSKEMLKILLTLSQYVTSTISSCQELVSSSASMQLTNSGRREAARRMSTKSPAKGVVKPMVSGHTITKPTINLNRVNMCRLETTGGLSTIEEVRTPPRIRETNASESAATSSAQEQRCEPVRRRRLLERLSLASPPNSVESERRLSRRSNRRSGRLSGKHSRPSTSRLSQLNSPTKSSRASSLPFVGSPRVKLNDVSKLLQNSQSINIRMLNESNEEADDVTDHDSGMTIPETPEHSRLVSDTAATRKDENRENGGGAKNKAAEEDLYRSQRGKTRSEDPLEGPSWLYDSSDSDQMAMDQHNKTDSSEERQEDTELDHTEVENRSLDNQTESINVSKRQREVPTNIKPTINEGRHENGMKFTDFVTQRRGYTVEETEEEDMEDFTLIYTQHPRNMNFDINDLKLPVLDESAIKRPVVREPEPEITTTLQKIAETYTIPPVARSGMDESMLNQLTVKLPVLPSNDCNQEFNTSKAQSSTHLQKRLKRVSIDSENEYVDSTLVVNKGKSKKRSSISDKDPSAAKVVLEKLSDYDVRIQTPSSDDSYQSGKNTTSPLSSRLDNSSDSESNSSSSSAHVRGLRRKRPISLQEPSLRRKLRR